MAVYSNEKILVKYPRQMNFFFFDFLSIFLSNMQFGYQRTADPDTPTQRPPPPVAYPKSPNFLYQKMFPFLFNQKILWVIISYVNFQLKKCDKGEKIICLEATYVCDNTQPSKSFLEF